MHSNTPNILHTKIYIAAIQSQFRWGLSSSFCLKGYSVL